MPAGLGELVMSQGEGADALLEVLREPLHRDRVLPALPNERPDKGQDVLYAVIEFRDQEGLSLVGVAALAVHDVRAAQDDFEQRASERLGDLQLRAAPGHRLPVDDLTPSVEALPRTDARRSAFDGDGLLGISTPSHGLHDLAAEEQKVFPRRPREWDRQDAADVGHVVPGRGKLLRQGIRGIGLLRAPLAEVAEQVGQRLGRRRRADALEPLLGPDPEAVARDHGLDEILERGRIVEDRLLRSHPGDEPVVGDP